LARDPSTQRLHRLAPAAICARSLSAIPLGSTTMYQVACEVFPPTNSADYGRLDYAVAVVFADRTNAPDAEAAARDLLKHEGWELEEVLYVREARLEDIDAGLPAHAAFELA